jgi:hypothetical protein
MAKVLVRIHSMGGGAGEKEPKISEDSISVVKW